MEDETHKRKGNGILRRLITLAVVIAAAWLLGQWIVPAFMKAIFL